MISSDTNITHFLENTLKNKFKSKMFLDLNPTSLYNKINRKLILYPY